METQDKITPTSLYMSFFYVDGYYLRLIVTVLNILTIIFIIKIKY